MTSEEQAAVDRFKAFLRVKSTSHSGPVTGTYAEAVALLKQYAEEIGLVTTVVECVPKKPILICTLKGENSSLKSIILNSHYDVVPTEDSKWSIEDPFAAVERSNGDILARGTQDMKCVCIQYLEAIRRLLAAKTRFLRDVHLIFNPDEELGGVDGMNKFVDTDSFKALNAGVGLDEGLANPGDAFTLFYGERVVWWLKLKATGNTGHGSRFIQDTATRKLLRAVDKMLEFRDEQEKLLLGSEHTPGCKHAVAKKLGDVVTLNLTMLKAGVTTDNGRTFALNVVPPEAEAGFDIRIPPHITVAEFEKKLQQWTWSEGVEYEFLVHSPDNATTSLSREKNGWWAALSDLCQEMTIKLEPEIFPAATDGRFLRNRAGIPVFGISPMRNTKVLMHDHDEYLNRATFIEGISFYEKLIQRFANLPPDS